MKKLIALLVLLCLLPLCAFAEMDEDGDIIVTLDGAEFFFTPVEGYCLTRESSASVFNRLGLSQREMLPYMEQMGVYAIMYDADLTCEVNVAAYETVETDFDELTEHGAAMLLADFEYAYRDQAYDVTAVELYQAPEGHKFIRCIASFADEDGQTAHMAEYLTNQAGYTVQIVLFALDGPVTDEHMALAESVVDSLWVMETE